VGFAIVYGLTVLVDPFSTGRYTPLAGVDFATRDILYGDAARARDPSFNAAIAGDSHAAQLNPKRLSAATGLRFAQVSSLGFNPNEALTVAAAFARGHPEQTRAIVVVIDASWCTETEVNNRIRGFFPTFIFEPSPVSYLSNVMFPEAVDAAAYRLLILAGLEGDRQRRDGYSPIRFTDSGWSAEQLATFSHWPRPVGGPAADAPLPALEQLRARAAALDAETRLVLLFTPVPFFYVPVSGSPAAKRLDYCKAGYREFANGRRHTAFVDRMDDDAFAHDMNNFGDTVHIRNRVAPLLERDIATALSGL
jgi:hypothetical protein